MPEISVVIPAYNEEAVIGRVVQGVQEALDDWPDKEVIVVDDGSTDRTAQVAQAAGARVVRHPYNKGNGAAVKTGIRAAQSEVIVLMDGDGQHDPRDIPRLVEHIGEYDMVVGARVKGSQQWHRQLANSVYNIFASYLAGFPIQDLTSGFRAIKRKLALQFCYLLPNTFSYPTTLTLAIVRGGYSLKYVKIKTAPRVGRSKIKLLRDGLRFLVIMTKIATLFSPLKVFLPLGLMTFLPGALYAAYRLIIGERWTIPIVISVSVGAIILSLGLISEQIALLRMQYIDQEVDKE